MPLLTSALHSLKGKKVERKPYLEALFISAVVLALVALTGTSHSADAPDFTPEAWAYLPLFARQRTPDPAPTPSPTATSTPASDPLIDALDGTAHLYSYDSATYLGIISSDCSHLYSIANVDGEHGSGTSLASINNPTGPYGSPTSPTSAFNPSSPEPPTIWTWTGTGYIFAAHCTVNPAWPQRIDPAYLVSYLRAKGNCE